ncbi:MAG: hypothetical protein QOE93_54 [Actinomycetota bacterium]|nr:hypothetical protein [Actinomycetota bacterium]
MGRRSTFTALLDDLRTSPDFVARSAGFGTMEKRRGTTLLVHPDLGPLRLSFEVLLLPGDVDEQRLVTWLATDDATAAALAGTVDRAVPSSPARLRIIG